MKKRPAILFLCWILLLPAAPFLRAQSATGGSIAGQISGIEGNLFRALVTIRNTATGIVTQTVSDGRGNFRFAEIAPGNYAVRVNAPGAAPWRAVNVTVEVGRITLLAPKMTIALAPPPKKSERHAPHSDLTPAVSSNVDTEMVQNLPSSTGHWSGLAVLVGGTAPDSGGTSAMSFRGLSPLLNGITLDGTDNTLAFHARERGTTSGGYATAQSAVSQFQVNSSNFSAEYGNAAGGVISSITKSGSNTLHGDAAFYERNSAWGAMNAYTKIMQAEPAGTTTTATGESVQYVNGQPITYVDVPYKAPDRRLQGSFDAGGPIRRDRLFWFFAADYHDRNFPGVARANEPEVFFANPSAQTVQTLAARIGQTPAEALTTYEMVLNQLSGVLGSVPRSSRQLIFFPKIDWKVNSRIHLIGQYNHMHRTAPNGVLTGASETYGVGSFGDSSSTEDAGVARLEYFLTPAVLNNARFQYSRDLLSQLSAKPAAFELPFAQNEYGLSPQISIDRSSGLTLGTLSTEDKAQYPLETRQQFVDAVTWIHQRHAIRFGYDYNHVIDDVSGLNQQNGEYSYSSFANFVSDMIAPNHCDGTATGVGNYPCYSWFRQTVGPSVWQIRTADYAAFAADDWKLTPNFTLSFGVRYEYEVVPDVNAQVANPAIPQTAFSPHDRNNFGPRAGFAWDIFGHGHTVLRGGYGLYYGRISNATIYSAVTATGSAHSVRNYLFRSLDAGAPPFPYVFSPEPDIAIAPNAIYFDRHFQNPQIEQAQLSVQQELDQRTAITLTWMGSLGRELPNFIDTNIDLNAASTLHYALDFTDNPQHLGPLQNNFSIPFYYQRLNPNYGSITAITSATNSSYQGAMVRLTRRTFRAVDINAAYTYSHAIDDNQNEATFANLNNVYSPDPSPAAQKIEHGTSNFDLRQRASGGFVLHEPWRFSGFWQKVFNGYTISGMGEWRTGLPYTMRTMGSIPASECSYQQYESYGGALGGGANCATDPVNAGGVIEGVGVPIPGLGPSLNGSGGEDLIPMAGLGRNSFRYPGAVGLDARVAKRTSITDRMAVEFFAEAFNVLNHQNVTDIQTIGYRIENNSSTTGTASVAYLSGMKSETTTQANGDTQTELVASPTAAFGSVTNANSNALYHQRQIQVGCKLFF